MVVTILLLLSSPVAAQDSSAADRASHRAFVLARVGHFADATLHARRAVELAPSAEAYSNLGTFSLLNGEFDAAVAAFRRAIELDPSYRTAYSNLGNAYTDAGMLDSAIALHRRAIALDSSRAGGYNDLGTALEKNGQPEESMLQFRRSLALDSNNAITWYNLGVSYYRLKRWPQTLNAFLTALAIDEFYPNLFETLQVVSTEGRSDFEQSAVDHPDDPMAHYYLAFAFSYQRNWGKALKEINRATELAKSPEFARARAWIESRRGEDEKAIAAARSCTSTDWSCYLVIGYSLNHLERPREALVPLLAADNINPNIVNVQQQLGVAYWMIGEYEKAAAAFERAVTLGAQSPNTEFSLAMVYKELRKFDLAWEHARILERTGHPSAQSLIQDLARWSAEPKW